MASTKLAEALGDEAWDRLLTWHDDTLRALVAGGGGELVKSTGDGFFAAFDAARPAMDCAISIQQALANHRRSSGFALAMRIGLHTAEASRSAADYSGWTPISERSPTHRSPTMETTMTRIDRGSTATTTIYADGGDLVFERTFDAPRERVWKAFMDPEIVPRWWGPHGTTTTIVEMDVRPGGTWRYVSHSPDRDDVAFFGEYLEIDPIESFRWTFLFDVEGLGAQGGPETHTFEDLGLKTRIVSIGHLGSPEAIDGALATGMAKGAIETWDRLEAVLGEG